jgi:hypothetical protein
MFPGSDLGAQINSAVASCVNTGCTVEVPVPAAGTSYSFSTSIALANNIMLHCNGNPNAGQLNYTGSGTAVDFNNASHVTVDNCGLQLASTASIGFKIWGQYVSLKNFGLMGGGSSSIGIYMTGA